jgi:hypothetical protein
VDDEGVVLDDALAPPVGGVVFVSGLDGGEGSLDEVTSGSGRTFGFGVDVVDTGEVEELLGDGRSHKAGSSGGGHESHLDGSALAGDLAWDGVDSTDLVAPISLSDGDEVQFRHSDGALDGSLHFLVAFPAETEEVLFVSDDGVGFEAGALTGLGLLLDGLDFHDFLLDGGAEEGIDDFLLLDGDGEAENVNNVLNEFVLDESAKFGDGLPLDLIFLAFGPLAALLVVGATSESSAGFGFRCNWCGSLFCHKSLNNKCVFSDNKKINI